MQTPSKKSANLKDESFCESSECDPAHPGFGADPIVVHSPSLHTRVFSNESANTRLAQGYHDSYFLKECHDIR